MSAPALRKQLLTDLREVLSIVYPHGFVFLIGGCELAPRPTPTHSPPPSRARVVLSAALVPCAPPLALASSPIFSAQEKKLSAIHLVHPPANTLHLRSDPIAVTAQLQAAPADLGAPQPLSAQVRRLSQSLSVRRPRVRRALSQRTSPPLSAPSHHQMATVFGGTLDDEAVCLPDAADLDPLPTTLPSLHGGFVTANGTNGAIGTDGANGGAICHACLGKHRAHTCGKQQPGRSHFGVPPVMTPPGGAKRLHLGSALFPPAALDAPPPPLGSRPPPPARS